MTVPVPFPRGASAFRADNDLRRILDLVARARAGSDERGFLHPGGLQWWLRKLGQPDFSVHQWGSGRDLAAFVIDDDGYVIAQAAAELRDSHVELIEWAEAHLRPAGRDSIEVSIWDHDPELRSWLLARGYEPSGTYAHELVHQPATPLPKVPPPEGFRLSSLEPRLDDEFVALHRDAWSTWGPSSYDAVMHARVTAMPDFDRELVPVAIARDGTLAAYCIGWLDALTRTVEIEPLGTRPQFRRRGLARAVLGEVVRRSRERSARSVMVWGVERESPRRRALSVLRIRESADPAAIHEAIGPTGDIHDSPAHW